MKYNFKDYINYITYAQLSANWNFKAIRISIILMWGVISFLLFFFLWIKRVLLNYYLLGNKDLLMWKNSTKILAWPSVRIKSSSNPSGSSPSYHFAVLFIFLALFKGGPWIFSSFLSRSPGQTIFFKILKSMPSKRILFNPNPTLSVEVFTFESVHFVILQSLPSSATNK